MNSVIHEKYSVAQDDFANAGKASSHIKEHLKELGVNPQVLRRIAVACYESDIQSSPSGTTITLKFREQE